MSEFRAIVFDYFGVICSDQYAAWLRQNKHQRTGEYQHLSQKTESGEMSMAAFFAGLAQLSGVPAEQIEADFRRNTDIDHNVLRLIISLKRHYKIGLLTNSSTEWIDIALDQFHLRAIFDVAVVSGDVGFIKPQPQIYQIMLERLGLPAAQTIFVDDGQTNVETARKLGMTALLYNNIEALMFRLNELGVMYE